MPDRTLHILEKMLDVSAYRRKLIASNIANVDTPGYKAKDIDFQKELQKALALGQSHSYEPFEVATTMQNRDGNTVNLELQLANSAENTLLYNTAVMLLSYKIRMTKDILRQR